MSRRIPTRNIVKEVKEILEYANIFNNIDIGQLKPLSEQNTFPSCYLKVDGTTAELNGNMGIEVGCEYDRGIILRIIMQIELQDPLEFLDYQDKVESVILKDNPLWKIVLDRDFIGSEWDNDVSYPKKEGEVAFLLKWRSDV